MIFGRPIKASTKRRGVTNLASLTLRAPLGKVLQPRSQRWATETFNEDIRMPFAIYADWPHGYTGDMPVQPGDMIVLTSTGDEYPVFGCMIHQGRYLVIGAYLTPE